VIAPDRIRNGKAVLDRGGAAAHAVVNLLGDGLNWARGRHSDGPGRSDGRCP
jgi:hypothetical protein